MADRKKKKPYRTSAAVAKPKALGTATAAEADQSGRGDYGRGGRRWVGTATTTSVAWVFYRPAAGDVCAAQGGRAASHGGEVGCHKREERKVCGRSAACDLGGGRGGGLAESWEKRGR